MDIQSTQLRHIAREILRVFYNGAQESLQNHKVEGCPAAHVLEQSFGWETRS